MICDNRSMKMTIIRNLVVLDKTGITVQSFVKESKNERIKKNHYKFEMKVKIVENEINQFLCKPIFQ